MPRPPTLVYSIRGPRKITGLSPKTEVGNAQVYTYLGIRRENPDFGARRIQYELRYKGYKPPSVSTIHRVLVRAGLVYGHESEKEYVRFEMSKRNELWRFDIKGPLNIRCYDKVYLIDIIDDRSRFVVRTRLYD